MEKKEEAMGGRLDNMGKGRNNLFMRMDYYDGCKTNVKQRYLTLAECWGVKNLTISVTAKKSIDSVIQAKWSMN